MPTMQFICKLGCNAKRLRPAENRSRGRCWLTVRRGYGRVTASPPRENPVRFLQRLFRADVEPESRHAPGEDRGARVKPLHEPAGLEHDAFADRARHFAERLESSASAQNDSERSPVLDQLFVDEAHEQLDLLRDALAALPPDAYALTTEALKLAQHAEMLEIWGAMHLARQFAECVNRYASELDSTEARDALDDILQTLTTTIDAVAV